MKGFFAYNNYVELFLDRPRYDKTLVAKTLPKVSKKILKGVKCLPTLNQGTP
jgi:hypothetical protein